MGQCSNRGNIMAIKLIEITKGFSTNAVGDIIFTYNVVDDKGVPIIQEPLSSTMSANYDNADIKDIAGCLLRDAESKEYEVMRQVKAAKFDVEELKTEIEKRIAEKTIEVVIG